MRGRRQEAPVTRACSRPITRRSRKRDVRSRNRRRASSVCDDDDDHEVTTARRHDEDATTRAPSAHVDQASPLSDAPCAARRYVPRRRATRHAPCAVRRSEPTTVPVHACAVMTTVHRRHCWTCREWVTRGGSLPPITLPSVRIWARAPFAYALRRSLAGGNSFAEHVSTVQEAHSRLTCDQSRGGVVERLTSRRPRHTLARERGAPSAEPRRRACTCAT